MAHLVIEHQIYIGVDFNSKDWKKELRENYLIILVDDTKLDGRTSLGVFDTQQDAINFCMYYRENRKPDVVYQL